MIRSFRHKGLGKFWNKGDKSGLGADLVDRIRRRLDVLNAASRPDEMNLPGFNFHSLRGNPQRYTVHVNGPYCLTFAWHETDAIEIDPENYH